MSTIDALMSSSQQAVLGLLYSHPERSFYVNEIIRSAKLGHGSIQRELRKLVTAGILKKFRRGNQVHYQANDVSPIFPELVSIVRKTIGLAEPIRRALSSRRRD